MGAPHIKPTFAKLLFCKIKLLKLLTDTNCNCSAISSYKSRNVLKLNEIHKLEVGKLFIWFKANNIYIIYLIIFQNYVNIICALPEAPHHPCLLFLYLELQNCSNLFYIRVLKFGILFCLKLNPNFLNLTIYRRKNLVLVPFLNLKRFLVVQN